MYYWYGDNEFEKFIDASQFHAETDGPWKTQSLFDSEKPSHRCVAEYGFTTGWKNVECGEVTDTLTWVCSMPTVESSNDDNVDSGSDDNNDIDDLNDANDKTQIKVIAKQSVNIQIGTRQYQGRGN